MRVRAHLRRERLGGLDADGGVPLAGRQHSDCVGELVDAHQEVVAVARAIRDVVEDLRAQTGGRLISSAASAPRRATRRVRVLCALITVVSRVGVGDAINGSEVNRERQKERLEERVRTDQMNR